VTSLLPAASKIDKLLRGSSEKFDKSFCESRLSDEKLATTPVTLSPPRSIPDNSRSSTSSQTADPSYSNVSMIQSITAALPIYELMLDIGDVEGEYRDAIDFIKQSPQGVENCQHRNRIGIIQRSYCFLMKAPLHAQGFQVNNLIKLLCFNDNVFSKVLRAIADAERDLQLRLNYNNTDAQSALFTLPKSITKDDDEDSVEMSAAFERKSFLRQAFSYFHCSHALPPPRVLQSPGYIDSVVLKGGYDYPTFEVRFLSTLVLLCEMVPRTLRNGLQR